MKSLRHLTVAILLLASTAALAVTAVVTPGDWALYKGTSIVSRHASESACVEAAKALNQSRSYTCRTSTGVVVTVTADPVDCVVSSPVVTTGAWSACSAGKRTRTITSTVTVLTKPANGGKACPELVTTKTETESCGIEAKISASPQTLTAPGTSLITWSCSRGSAVLSSQGQSQAVPATGSISAPVSTTTVVSLTCKDGTEQAQQSTTITVSASPPPPPPPATTAVQLKWDAVTQNTDGTAVTVSSYRLEYGKGDFSQSQDVAGLTTKLDLTSGTWNFRVRANVPKAGEWSQTGTKSVP